MDEDSSGKGNDGINDNCAKVGDAMRCDDSSNECSGGCQQAFF